MAEDPLFGTDSRTIQPTDIAPTAVRTWNVQNGITIKNKTQTSIVDPKGLVSSHSFTNGSVVLPGFTPSYPSFGDVSGSTITLTVSRTTNILVGYSLQTFTDNGTGLVGTVGCTIYINIDGADQTSSKASILYLINPAPTRMTFTGTVAKTRIFTLANGTHTIKLRAQGDGGLTTVPAGGDLWYIILGT